MKWKENDSWLQTFYRDGIWNFWIVRSNESKKSATTCQLNNISRVELDYNVMKGTEYYVIWCWWRILCVVINEVYNVTANSEKLIATTEYTGCPGRNMPDFGRMFLKLKYTDLTKNTCIQSWTVTEIMAREKCGLLAVPPTLPGSRDVLFVHCAFPSFSLQPGEAHSRCDCTCKLLKTLRTTATLVRVFM